MALKDDIQNQTFKRLYLIYGQDDFLREKNALKLKDAVQNSDTMNYMEKEGGDLVLSELNEFTDTIPFFGPRRVLYLKNTGLFKAGSDENFEGWLKNLPETAVVIFQESDVDKRKALYKVVQTTGSVYCFDPPTEELLATFVLQKVKQEHKNITKDAYHYLIENLPCDYLVAENELEKLFAYTMDQSDIRLADVEMIVTRSFETQVYELTDYVTNGKRDEAMAVYLELLTSQKADPFQVMAMVGKEFLRFLVVKEMSMQGASDDEMVKALTLNPKILWKYKRDCQRMKTGLLKEALATCTEFEESAKNGDISPKYGCELLIFKLTDLMNQKKR